MAGMELTRVTAIDWNGSILLDELCQTQFPVLDLNTRFSGIKSLQNAKYTLGDIQSKIQELSGSHTIFVGHGLENDLKALRIIHRKVIDTAAQFPHPKGFPFRHSLRNLVQMHLGRFIQMGTEGHDSLEDTLATIDLLKHLIKKK